MQQPIPTTIDEYIAQCPQQVQPKLNQLRNAIAKTAPEAKETISWGMATFVYLGNLVHFSAQKKHIGFHPGASPLVVFEKELAGFCCSKGTIRLPYEAPLPLELIEKIVRFRLQEQRAEADAKKAGQKSVKVVRARYDMPEDVTAALWEQGLEEQYALRPPYQRNDYIGWISRAKRADTRQKRLSQMLEELRAGDRYMGMAYNAPGAKQA